MSVLEDRYRTVLRMLPASYRAVWEQEMVATFLSTHETDDVDEAEYRAEFGRPGVAEVASVAALAARLHFGGADAAPRSFAWGEAVRRVALVGLLAYAANATVLSVQRVWLSGAIGWPAVPERIRALMDPAPRGAWVALLEYGGLVWLGAFLALVFGRRRAATVFAVVGVLAPLSVLTLDLFRGREPVVLSGWLGIGVGALLVLALAAFHDDAPPVQHRPWLVAFGVGLLVGAASEFAFLTQDVPSPAPLDWPAMACAVMVVAASVHLCRPASGPWFGALSWSLALAFLGLIVLGLRVVSLIDLRTTGPYPGRPTMIILAGAEAAVVLAVLIPLVVVAVRSLRHLPPASANLDSFPLVSRQSPHPGRGPAT